MANKPRTEEAEESVSLSFVNPKLFPLYVEGIKLTAPLAEDAQKNLVQRIVFDPELAYNWHGFRRVVLSALDMSREDARALFLEWIQRLALVAAQHNPPSRESCEKALAQDASHQVLVPVHYKESAFEDKALDELYQSTFPLLLTAHYDGRLEKEGKDAMQKAYIERQHKQDRISTLIFAQSIMVSAILCRQGIYRYFAFLGPDSWKLVYHDPVKKMSWLKSNLTLPSNTVGTDTRILLNKGGP
ncbi:MAG TPA: hypothetical protein VLA04_03260 [Verrucomicrobiae bacterium]|nr:hypothetical protein [Verrucomicrobiae bacterium]